MILRPEDITPTHEKWLTKLLNLNKVQFTVLCHQRDSTLEAVYNTLNEQGAEEMEHLWVSGAGHSEKEIMIRDLRRIVLFSLNGQADETLFLAHEYSIFNKELLTKSKFCGCFACLKIFTPDKIEDWCDFAEDTALCPYCGIDSVLPDAADFPVSATFLQQMQEFWFSNDSAD